MQRHIPAAHLLFIVFGISILFASCSGPLALNNRHYGRGMYVKAEKEKQTPNRSTVSNNATPREHKLLSLLPQRRAELTTVATPAYAQKRTTPANHWKQTTARASRKENAATAPAIASTAQSTVFTTVPLYQQQSAEPITGSVSFLLMIVGIVFIVLGAVFFVLGSWILGALLGLVGLVFFLLSLLL